MISLNETLAESVAKRVSELLKKPVTYAMLEFEIELVIDDKVTYRLPWWSLEELERRLYTYDLDWVTIDDATPMFLAVHGFELQQ